MRIEIQTNDASQPIEHEAKNTYIKGGMYCVMVEDSGIRKVYKYPLVTLFRVIEDY